MEAPSEDQEEKLGLWAKAFILVFLCASVPAVAHLLWLLVLWSWHLIK